MEISLKTLSSVAILVASLAISSAGRAQSCPVQETTMGPLVLYTDITSGPTSGGENNKGIYLSIFGKNFGSYVPSVKVYINNVEVDNYRYLGPSKGRSDIQQLTVQVGALGNAPQRTPLPIKVVVNGASSNSDLTFMVNPGTIYFVDNVNGVDNTTTTTGGDFANPFRSLQKNAGKKLDFSIDPASSAGAWGRVQAGDFIVMRGKGTPYTDIGFDTYFFRALNKSGSAPGATPACTGCKGSGPITIMGYPGEDVFVNSAYDPSAYGGAISSASSARIREGKGAWFTISNLRVEGGREDGVVNTQAGGNNWRVVNNELSARTVVANLDAKSAGISGNGSGSATGPGQFFLGNYIHDIYQGPEGKSPLQNHGIYVDSIGKYEIAFNRIERIRGGSGFQTYTTGKAGPPYIDNVSFHHNIIRDVAKHGINLADGTRDNIIIWNNVISDTDYAGIRLGGTSYINNLKLYNNTVFRTARIGTNDKGVRTNFAALTNEMLPRSNQVDIRNNIFSPTPGTKYVIDSNGGFAAGNGIISNNLWFGGLDENPANTFSLASLQSDPSFVLPGIDFRLQNGSPAIGKGTSAVANVVKDDHDATYTAATSDPLSLPNTARRSIGAYHRTNSK